MAKILFIAIDYYSYTRSILNEMTAQGHDVDFFPIEKPTFLHKTVKRYLPRIYRKILDLYHAQIVELTKKTPYNRIVFLQTHHFSHENIQALRRSHPESVFTLCNWDSLTTHDYQAYIKYFDRVFTFDIEDADKLNVHYLSNFAVPGYFEMHDPQVELKYDIYFVGSVHTMSRYNALGKLKAYARENGLRLKLYLHISPAMFLQLLPRGRLWPEMSMRSISTADIIAIMHQSIAVFDFPNHRQSGYTMRLIENLCANKKIITSNAYARSESFYSTDRIFVFEDWNFDGIAEFVRSPITSTPNFSSLSLRAWVSRVLT